MAFFNGSSNFIVNGGTFSIYVATPDQSAVDGEATLLGKRKEHECELDAVGLKKKRRCTIRNSDGLMIVRRGEFDLGREVINNNNHRIHSASYGGRVVAVKVFEGPNAVEDWTVEVASSKRFLHPNIPQIVGVSDETSESPFVIFHGVSEKRLQSLIAKALRTDLNLSIQLSMKAVKGLAAGLSYIKSKVNGQPSGAVTRGWQWQWESLDILAGSHGEPVIMINPSSIGYDDLPVPQYFDLEGYGTQTLNRLCQKLFTEVNSILYDDSPVRLSDEYNPEDLPTTMRTDIHSVSDVLDDDDPTTILWRPKESSKPRRASRREVLWRLDADAKSRSLDSIARRYEDYLDCFESSSSELPLRRLRPSRDARLLGRILHRCPGYLREEITLTSDVSRSAIVSHEYPNQSELCSGCGQLVQVDAPVNVPVFSSRRAAAAAASLTIAKMVASENSAAPFNPSKTQPPTWLSSAMQAMQIRYPEDKFEVILRNVNASSTPGWRIKCLDCPGKLYVPGPGETLSNYEVHLKNLQHRSRVNNRFANAQRRRTLRNTRGPHSSSLNTVP